MPCEFSKYINKKATHYVGSTGKEYPIGDGGYINHGFGGVYRGFKDLPHDEYPYTIKYKETFIWKFCEQCNCVDKPILN